MVRWWLLGCVLLTACGGPQYRPAKPAASPPPRYYQVSEGDTLYAIATLHNLDYRTVARWNEIAPPYVIYPGQRIRLYPPPGGAQPLPASRSRSASSTTPSQPPSKPPAARPPQKQPAPAPAPERVASASSIAWQWPTSGQVTRRFDPSGSGRAGIDIGGSAGQGVHAAAAGEVVYSGTGLVGYGELIIVQHSAEFLSAYGLNRKRLVSEGDTVSKGQKIAEMGESGDAPALHFEVRKNGNPINPLSVLPAR